MATETVSGRGNTPPYVPYPSFKTLIAELHEHGVPSRIDRSVLRRFSGIIGSQLLTTLRFLRLIGDQSRPTTRLAELVAASGTPEWGPKMIAILQEEYAPLFGLDLGNATASHFGETFRKSFPGSADSVYQKSVAFFLGAAKDSGIIISERVFHGRKPRSSSGNGAAPRRRTSPGANSSSAGGARRQQPPSPPPPDLSGLDLDPLLLALIRMIPPKAAGWPKDQRIRWFKTFAMNVTQVYDEPKDALDLQISEAARSA